MSNRLFQGIIHQMKDAVERIIGVIDENGVIISCSELVKIGETRQGIRDELTYTSDAIVTGGYTYRAALRYIQKRVYRVCRGRGQACR